MNKNLLLFGGTVVDPVARTERIADVLVGDGRILSFDPSPASIGDALHVDVSGCVVGPGFIDLHSHTHTIAGQRLQAMDGVTTVLDLEAGLMPVALAYRRAAEDGRVLNFGFSASWTAARANILGGSPPDGTFKTIARAIGDTRWQQSSTPAELARWLGLLEDELGEGALGVGVLLGYAPMTDPEEYTRVAHLASRFGRPVFTHARELIEVDAITPVDGPTEIVRAAAETGAAMHHCHVNATSRRHVDRVLRLIADARAAGSPVSVEAYPYGAGSTAIGAAFLEPARLRLWGIRPSNIVMLGTGERIEGAVRLTQLRAEDPAAACIVEFLDERDPVDAALLRRSLAFPGSIVASDAVPVVLPGGLEDTLEWPLPAGTTTHPRTAGTFAKTLRTMVRESGAWTWAEAFRRCSLLPAELVAGMAPAMRAKGRMEIGADADLIIIDPERVTDHATYLDPIRPSAGIRHSLVNGRFVVRDYRLCEDAFPGRAVRAD